MIDPIRELSVSEGADVDLRGGLGAVSLDVPSNVTTCVGGPDRSPDTGA